MSDLEQGLSIARADGGDGHHASMKDSAVATTTDDNRTNDTPRIAPQGGVALGDGDDSTVDTVMSHHDMSHHDLRRARDDLRRDACGLCGMMLSITCFPVIVCVLPAGAKTPPALLVMVFVSCLLIRFTHGMRTTNCGHMCEGAARGMLMMSSFTYFMLSAVAVVHPHDFLWLAVSCLLLLIVIVGSCMLGGCLVTRYGHSHGHQLPSDDSTDSHGDGLSEREENTSTHQTLPMLKEEVELLPTTKLGA